MMTASTFLMREKLVEAENDALRTSALTDIITDVLDVALTFIKRIDLRSIYIYSNDGRATLGELQAKG
jgi:hypothetical protein